MPIRESVTILGTGAMGGALARRASQAGHAVTVWNRTRNRAAELAGASVADTVFEAVRAAPTIVVCLLGHTSVHDVLDPVVAELAGRRLINVTTVTPSEARELADWAHAAGARYLQGGILAVPEILGTAAAEVLYSGARDVFDDSHLLRESWSRSSYLGDDAGLAAVYDLALLAGMYVMFAGFLHGVAMVGAAGVSASDFAARATPWLAAMTQSLAGFAAVVDGGDYGVPGQQSLEFSDLGYLVRASGEQGVDSALIGAVHDLVRRQIDAGFGADGFARIIESLRAVR